MCRPIACTRSGFTLIELAVVLTVIGLMVGGIIAGQSILRSSRIVHVLMDAQSYSTAIQQFHTHYEELPGDFSRAADVWTGGVSGNGSGFVDNATAPNASGENYQLWKHLASAGYITGNYTGMAGPGDATHAVPGTNIPEGGLRNTGYWFFNWGIQPNGGNFFAGDYTHLMTFGAARGVGWSGGPALSGVEAYMIDSKGDDGRPGLGRIRTLAATWLEATFATCITPAASGGNVPTAAEYRRDIDSPQCHQLYMNDFFRK